MLLGLLELADDPDGAEAVMELLAESKALMPDHAVFVTGFRELRISLEDIPFRDVDAIACSGCAPFDVYSAVRWAGARVEDICAALDT